MQRIVIQWNTWCFAGEVVTFPGHGVLIIVNSLGF